MIERYIYQGGRGGGKTYAIMSEIYEHIMSDARHSVLVVLPDLPAVEIFHAEWLERFPHLPRPDYVTLQNTLRVRGRFVNHIYVENVGDLDEGIYDPRFESIWPCLNDGGTITFTSRVTELSQRSHVVLTPPPRVAVAELLRRFIRGKRR